MKTVAILLIALAVSKLSFAQDTTGGTRPTIVIPLHKSPEKKAATQPQVLTTTVVGKKTASLNTTDSKFVQQKSQKNTGRKPL